MKAILALVLVGLCSCAKLAETPKDYLNHPAMDLTKRSTPDKSEKYTILGNQNGAATGGCATCAK